MVIFQDLSFRKTLPETTFKQLGQLLQQMAQEVETRAIVITEAVLALVPGPPKSENFTLLISPQFSALLVGNPVIEDEAQEAIAIARQRQHKQDEFGSVTQTLQYNVSLSFEPDEISLFLAQLSDLLKDHSQTHQTLFNYQRILQPNDTKIQSKFTLLLLSTLTAENTTNSASQSMYPFVSVCQPVEDALRQQIAQERLLNQVTTQIRQSMDLPIILTTAIEQVREFLQVDRLVIYQFDVETRNFASVHATSLPPGCITYEARATDSIPSVLNYKEANCFAPSSHCWEKYRQGFTLAIDDIETAYVLSKCLLAFLKKIQVRAKLVAPIVLQKKLWGLLIAHQCNEPRQWLEGEKNLLRQIAEQMAIAIYQAQLVRSLQQEKQTLEQRVIERTQALHDALITAQAASRAKTEFLARMSHELRSPLTCVIGMSSTLLRWQSEQMNQQQKHYLQVIHDSGEHLLELINDILDLSQVEAGKIVLNISEFSLLKLAEDLYNSLSQKAERQQVNLEIDLKLTPPNDYFTADQKRVYQIFWNLLSNAIKFTSAGGQVCLRVWIEKNIAILQVEDTGIGISQEQLPLLFEKFQQLDTPYNRRYEGTGLGLALTKQLVELHQGRIEVESTPGVGSIFTVFLPNQKK